MSEHTPGMWVARPDPNNKITGRDDWCIGVPGGAPDEVAVCSERDALVISAAPEMLLALKLATNEFTFGGFSSSARAAIFAAIAKATGEQS